MKKRSIRISRHDTSVTLEDEFWVALKDMAKSKSISINALILEIDESREGNLSSALRLYVLKELQNELAQQIT